MKDPMSEYPSAIDLAFFIVMALLIGIIVHWSVESKSEKCSAICNRDGLQSIRVSKAAMCLCYDSDGSLKVPRSLFEAR